MTVAYRCYECDTGFTASEDAIGCPYCLRHSITRREIDADTERHE